MKCALRAARCWQKEFDTCETWCMFHWASRFLSDHNTNGLTSGAGHAGSDGGGHGEHSALSTQHSALSIQDSGLRTQHLLGGELRTSEHKGRQRVGL